MSSWQQDFDFDFEVGTDATAPSLLPGKDQATTGHHYVAIFPKIGEKEGTGRAEKHETKGGQEPPITTRKASRATIGDEPRDTPIDRHSSPVAAEAVAAETVVRTHFPSGKEHKIKTDDQGIGAFRAAQAPEQKPTIGPKFTDDNPWVEPVTAGDTITGATSQDAYNANARQSGHSGLDMTSGEYRENPERRRMGQDLDQRGPQAVKDNDNEPGLRRRTDVPAEHGD